MSVNIGALTTTFTPPSSCLASDNIWKVYTTCPGNDRCYYLLQGPPRTSDCLPKGYNFDTTAYYSPGICPSGYTAACSQLNTLNQFTETAYTCCPTVRSYDCLTDKSTQYWPFQVSFGCASAYKGVGTEQVIVSDRFSTTSGVETYNGNGGINAFAIQVRRQSTDFVSTIASVHVTSNPATPASTQSLPTSTSTASPDHITGLGTGAKAGIGVGIALGICALAALFWLVYRAGKRRNRPTTEHEQEHLGVMPAEGKPALPAYQDADTWGQRGHDTYQADSLASEPHVWERHEVSGVSREVAELRGS